MNRPEAHRPCLLCLGNPMIDMFLPLPEEARSAVPARRPGTAHIAPEKLDVLIETLRMQFPDYVQQMAVFPGGGAVSMLSALSRYTLPVSFRFSGAAGKDVSGENIKKHLDALKVHHELQISSQPTGRMLYCRFSSGKGKGVSSAAASPGAAVSYRFSEDMILPGEDLFVEGFLSPHAGFWERGMHFLDRVHRLILDLGNPSAAERTAPLISCALEKKIPLLLFGTADELSALTAFIPEKTLIHRDSVLVEKQGEAGAEVRAAGKRYHCPPAAELTNFPEILTAGAGDALCAGFLAYIYRHEEEDLLEGDLLLEALQQGSQCAAEHIAERAAGLPMLLS